MAATVGSTERRESAGLEQAAAEPLVARRTLWPNMPLSFRPAERSLDRKAREQPDQGRGGALPDRRFRPPLPRAFPARDAGGRPRTIPSIMRSIDHSKRVSTSLLSNASLAANIRGSSPAVAASNASFTRPKPWTLARQAAESKPARSRPRWVIAASSSFDGGCLCAGGSARKGKTRTAMVTIMSNSPGLDEAVRAVD